MYKIKWQQSPGIVAGHFCSDLVTFVTKSNFWLLFLSKSHYWSLFFRKSLFFVFVFHFLNKIFIQIIVFYSFSKDFMRIFFIKQFQNFKITNFYFSKHQFSKAFALASFGLVFFSFSSWDLKKIGHFFQKNLATMPGQHWFLRYHQKAFQNPNYEKKFHFGRYRGYWVIHCWNGWYLF